MPLREFRLCLTEQTQNRTKTLFQSLAGMLDVMPDASLCWMVADSVDVVMVGICHL